MYITNCQIDSDNSLIGVNLLLTCEGYVAIHIFRQIAIHRENDLKCNMSHIKKEMIGT